MHTVSLLSRDFRKYYLITMRPYLLFVSGITGLLGLSFAPEMPLLKTLILFVAFFLSYGFGQALTDCFQTDTDALSSPYRPLVRGVIGKSQVMAVSLAGLGLCGLILTLAAPVNLPLALLAVLGLATYTYFKKRWWAGPFYNAWIVLVLAVIACVAGYGYWPAAFFRSSGALLAGLIVFLGYANFVLIGYFKDVSADRQTGYRTLPVVFGFTVSAVVSDVLALAQLAAFWLLLRQGEALLHWAVVLFGGAGLVTLVYAQIRAHTVRSEREAHKAVVPVVHAYLLILSALILYRKPQWVWALTAFYVAFVFTMKFRPERTQI
jgi:4-hydroxybenzoate polyprenyltransferase